MSGHSKWHSIRRSKAIVDNKRGAVFTKIAREITVAVRESGSGDPDVNFKLRTVLLKARAENMPAENIKRAIEKGSGAAGATAEEEITYEGYGPAGCAILVQALTDNRNRTASEVRNAFTKGGGNLGESNSVGYLFERKGVIRIALEGKDADEVMLSVIDAGADDVQGPNEDEELEVYTAFEDTRKVTEALEKQGFKVLSSETAMIPATNMELEPGKTLQALRLIERLEDLDDVQNVYTNLHISEEVAATLEG
ncbi:MAG: YebC/PmpR family DNA-binding transcriptional regulator [Chloroflexota bacterium]|nr:YebC/PmpR family DNA-binding transcriptional regulator [Chloroflexota bacterium]